MRKLFQLDVNFYHVIDQKNNSIVAVITGRPWDAMWIATDPKTKKILATDSRKEDLFRKMGVV
jgi:hypothetical protein